MIDKLKGALRSRFMHLGTLLVALGGWEGICLILQNNLGLIQPLFARWPWVQPLLPAVLGVLIWYFRWTTTQALAEKAAQ